MGRRHVVHKCQSLFFGEKKIPSYLCQLWCHCKWVWLYHRWRCSSCRHKCFQLANETTMAFIIIIIIIFVYLPINVPLAYWLNSNCPNVRQYFSKSEKYQTASCGFSLRVAQRDSVVILILFFFWGGGPYQRDSRQLHKVKGGCSASALWINGNIQQSGVAPPPSSLLNGDIQIYKWPWWRKRPWKIISSFIINERNSSRALCPLQTQFSNEKCCAPPHPLPLSPIHLSSAHPSCALWNSFIQVLVSRSGSQDRDANWLNYFQNQRMRRGAVYFRGQTCRPGQFPQSAP